MLNTVLLTIYDTVPYDWPHVIQASGLAIAGLVVTVVSTAVSVGMSVDAKNKQEAAQKKAQAESDKAMESARETIKQRKLANLAINLEGERTAAENAAVVAATGIQTARGGDPRQLAATIGRTQMANIAEQEALQATRARRVDDLELLKAKEEQDIQAKLADTYIGEAEGAQMAASDAAKLAAQYESQAIQAGVQGAGNIAQSAGAVGGAAQNANTAQARTSAEATMTGGYIDPSTVSQSSMTGPSGQGGVKITGTPALTAKYGHNIPQANQASFNSEINPDMTYDEWIRAYIKSGGKMSDIK
tara:strand:- start:116 stop:1024 length:909 start_codon:yes stop_codon:yes gene_type:complete